MPKLLYLLHGMGVHGKGWDSDVVDRLTTLPSTYGYQWFADHEGFGPSVRLVPVSYDEAFSDLLTQWDRSSAALGDFTQEHGIAIPDLLGWLHDVDEEEGKFFWSHLVDVLLYRFVPTVTARVRTSVKEQIATALLEASGDENEIVQTSVLAHSLGTSVAHDALALLATQPTEQGNRRLMIENHHFEHLFMLSNVSRVLETTPKVYESAVRPPGAGGAAYLNWYYNFQHRFDPFPAVKPFAPVGWGRRYRAVLDGERKVDFDTHDFLNYLDDPQVHIPIYRALFGNDSVTPVEAERAIAIYAARPLPPCVVELDGLRMRVEQMVALARVSGTPVSLIITGAQFLAAAKEAADDCA